MSLNGLKLGLDFTGGTLVEVSYNQQADLSSISNFLQQIRATKTTSTQISANSTWTDVGLEVTITPKASNSLIYLLLTARCGNDTSSSNGIRVIKDGATVIMGNNDYMHNYEFVDKLRRGRIIRLRQCLSYTYLLKTAIDNYEEKIVDDSILEICVLKKCKAFPGGLTEKNGKAFTGGLSVQTWEILLKSTPLG